MIISHLSLRHLAVVVCVSCVLSLGEPVHGQSDLPRRTVAITYPLDETISVKFRGTTLLPRLTGEAKVRRAGRRGTRVELSLDNLTRASELGGIYTTYLLWAVSPDGRVDNLGEGYEWVKLSLGRSFLIISPSVGRNLNDKQGDPR